MDSQKLDSHKKILGILYIISSALSIMALLLLNAILTTIFAFAFQEADPEEQRVMEFVLSMVRYVPVFVIVFISFPTLVAGIGLLTRQSWALILSLIIGCLKLFSFPVGTAIGIYAIWIYSEDQKLGKSNAAAT